MTIEAFLKQSIENPPLKSTKWSFIASWQFLAVLSLVVFASWYYSFKWVQWLTVIWLIIIILYSNKWKRHLKYGRLIAGITSWGIFVSGMLIPNIIIMSSGHKNELVSELPNIAISIELILAVIVLLIILIYQSFTGGFVHESSRYNRHQIRKKYEKTGVLHFSSKDYKEAATALENFKSITYQKAVKKYGERVIDILILARAVMYIGLSDQKLKRLVSIKSILEDREAGLNDD